MADEKQVQLMDDDFSYQGALQYFQDTGGREAETMLRQPLQYLKSGQVHKLRFMPGVPKAIAWFAPCQRHYMGRPTLAAIRRVGAKKSVICPASFSEHPCFIDPVRAYLEAVGSTTLANELVLSDVAIVYAYRANEADPQIAPYLITKSNINQLMDQWKEGYVFFHPVQGMAIIFRPIEGTNMFSVTPDARPSAVNPDLLKNLKPLSEVLESLLIPHETMKTWFVQPLVEAVEHFIATKEARPIDWKALTTTAAEVPSGGDGAAAVPPTPPTPDVEAPIDIPFDAGVSSVPAGDFISDLKGKIAAIGS